jgi:hypothetical protein
MTRRFFTGLALASWLRAAEREQRGLPGLPHFAPKASGSSTCSNGCGPSDGHSPIAASVQQHAGALAPFVARRARTSP